MVKVLYLAFISQLVQLATQKSFFFFFLIAINKVKSCTSCIIDVLQKVVILLLKWLHQRTVSHGGRCCKD